MVKINQPLPWDMNPSGSYIPISFEGKVVGFCKPDFAKQIIDALNDEETLAKALELACQDLAKKMSGSPSNDSLMQEYLARAQRPKSGMGAIAVLLQERQEELDLTDEEFAKFCDTFRLAREDLKNIYAGEELDSSYLSPLSRILGLTPDEIIQIWKGKD
jgi:hypothetical protein